MKILDVPQSGSVGAVTSSRNRYGQYRRQRATPVQPNSTAQQTAKTNLAARSQAWRSLTDAQRLAWDTYASEHPRTDALGQAITLTGHQMYNAINAGLLAAGYSAVTAVPDGSAVAACGAYNADDSYTLCEVQSTYAVPATNRIVTWSSPPLSAGRSFNGDFRIIKNVVGSNTTNQTLADYTDLAAKWGTLAVGQKFFFRSQVWDAKGNSHAFEPVSMVLT